MPDLSGRTVIVTGGNSGLGYETTRALAAKGAQVVLACRSLDKAGVAMDSIRTDIPDASLDAIPLDLASLASVRDFAKRFLDRYGALHLLCNNAGVMAVPYRKTAEGFEMQFGTNHLGHFALTGLLLPRLLESPGGRIVNVSSNAHRLGRINFEDLQSQRRYGKWRAYAQSKLANLLFSFELQRRLEVAGGKLLCVTCHPGYAATNLQLAGPRMEKSRWMETIAQLGNRLFAQSAAMGALPTLYAATSSDLRGGEYIGPDRGATWGYPKKERPSVRSQDAAHAAKLWGLSLFLTDVGYPALEV